MSSHALPHEQLLHFVPPQSVSLSSWFMMPSVHVGLQIPSLHVLPWQSDAARHFWPSAHFSGGSSRAQMPPQSTSVSSWFCAPSSQETQLLLVHLLVTQSMSRAHILPLAQASHVGPPQSTSVSWPLYTASVQLGMVHLPLEHIRESQSVFLLQTENAGQLPHLPPQSTPISSPFWRRSLQDASTMTKTPHSSPAGHTPQYIPDGHSGTFTYTVVTVGT